MTYGAVISLQPNVPRQKNTKDCGVLAIAIATSLLHALPFNFDQTILRRRLLECFMNLILTVFP